MFNKLKQFKDLRSQAKKMEEELATVVAEGSAAWGKVKVLINGNKDICDVIIDKEMMTDNIKLADAVKEAHKDALKKIQMKLAKKLQEMGGMDMLKNMGG